MDGTVATMRAMSVRVVAALLLAVPLVPSPGVARPRPTVPTLPTRAPVHSPLPLRRLQTGAAVSVTPNPALAGATVTIAASWPAVPGAGQTLSYGDGSAATPLPAGGGSNTFTHTYASVGTYQIAVALAGKVEASTMLVVTAPSDALTVAPTSSLVGQTVNATATFASATFKSATLAFGDGATASVPLGTTTVPHAYAAPGLYTLTLADPRGLLLATASERVGTQAATIVAQPAAQLVGTPFTFTVGVTTTFGVVSPPVSVTFGDGTSAALGGSGTLQHAYAAAGSYQVAVVSAAGAMLAATNVVAELASARIPLGTIYATSFTVSPVLAGNDTSILLVYSLATPASTFVNERLGLQAVVDLLTAQGELVRRSDPFAIDFAGAAGSGVRSATIPYSVPLDASGAYLVRVYLRSAVGGTIAVGSPVPLLVLSGPDPQPTVVDQFHSNGAVEFGPREGPGSTTINASAATSFQYPTYSINLEGLFDPISHRSEPLLTVKSSSQAPLGSPSSVQGGGGTAPSAPLPSGLVFDDVFGRTQGSLPALVGGGTQLTGADATYRESGTTYHAGYGYTQLPSPTTGSQRGTLFDLTRAVDGSGALRASIVNLQDDPASYLPSQSGPAGPQNSTTGVLEYDQTIARHLKAVLSGAVAASSGDVVHAPSVDDSADQTALNYTLGRTALAFAYEDAGPNMAVAGGPGALSDRAGFDSSAAFGLGPLASLTLGWNDEETRSAFSRQTTTSAQYSISPLSLPSLTFGYIRSGQDAVGSQQTGDQFNFAISKTTKGGAFSFNGSLDAIRDALQPQNDATTRTGQLQYSLQGAHGHALGIGFTGTLLGGASQTSTAGESLVYSFPFGGRVGAGGAVVHGLSLSLSASNSNVRALASGGHDQVLDALLSYHLSSHLALSAHVGSQRHFDIVPANSNGGGFFRVRLDSNL